MADIGHCGDFGDVSIEFYTADAYVDRAFSEETARLIPTMRPWITKEYEHDGLRINGGRILDRLINLANEYP